MILLTGAAGFLGRFVAAELQRAGLDALSTDLQPADSQPQPFLPCDLSAPAAVDALFEAHPIDTVIHLAAVLPSASRANPALATRVNVDAGNHLIEAAARAGVHRFVYGSSMSVYGATGDGTPLTEAHPAAPTDLYGAAKRYIEIRGALAAASAALSFVSLRLAIVVGPGARNTASPWRSQLFEPRRTADARRISVAFRPDAVLSLVHAADAARMLTLLATRDHVPAPVYNSPATNWSLAELKRAVESADPGTLLEADPESPREAPPVADGSLFLRHFDFAAPSIAARLPGAAG